MGEGERGREMGEIWRYGGDEIWGEGDMEIWRETEGEMGKDGDMEDKNYDFCLSSFFVRGQLIGSFYNHSLQIPGWPPGVVRSAKIVM